MSASKYRVRVGEGELGCDLAVRESARDQVRDLPFTSGQQLAMYWSTRQSGGD
jgi:hypothetical protein